MTSPPKLRRFRCPPRLWEVVEEMALEDDCSLDVIVTSALASQARGRGYDVGDVELPRHFSVESTRESERTGSVSAKPKRLSSMPPAQRKSRPGSVAPKTTTAPPVRGPLPPPPAPPPTASPPQTASRLPVPHPPSRSLPPAPPPRTSGGPPPPPPRTSGGPPPPPPPRPITPPPPPKPPALPIGASRPPPLPKQPDEQQLWLFYAGARFHVDKDRFFIGRVKTSSDLVIKDPNVSRQHAVIEKHGDIYLIVDLDSTNGVIFDGKRVKQRAIEDGDAFYICEHELRFAFS